MYFAILGKNKIISLKELEIVAPRAISFFGKSVVIFDTDKPELLTTLGGMIKSGRIVSLEEAAQKFSKDTIVGIPELHFGMFLKKNFGVKRFKEIDPESTDREIKEKGFELFPLEKEHTPNMKVGLVENYQNINLYEVIDFDKPARGMHIGMMPAKLTHILINIGVGRMENSPTTNRGRSLGEQSLPSPHSHLLTIRDPFVGFGTTCLVANALGYNSMGSDKNITPAKLNLARRKQNEYHNDLPLTFFKHNVADPITQPFLKHVNVIVTEGYLGPIISQFINQKLADEIQEELLAMYTTFFTNLNILTQPLSLVLTLPRYENNENRLAGELIKVMETLGWQSETLEEIYGRKDQFVKRQILVGKK